MVKLHCSTLRTSWFSFAEDIGLGWHARKVYGGEECFLVYPYHLTKGMPVTEMA
jgi:hypothetical protein